MAPEPHSFALRILNRGGVLELAIRPVDLEALHLGTLQCCSREIWWVLRRSGSAGATENTPSAWLWRTPWRRGSRRFLAPGGPSQDREKFADAWRRWVEGQFPVEGMMHLPQPPSVARVRPTAPVVALAKAVPKAAPKPPPQEGP